MMNVEFKSNPCCRDELSVAPTTQNARMGIFERTKRTTDILNVVCARLGALHRSFVMDSRIEKEDLGEPTSFDENVDMNLCLAEKLVRYVDCFESLFEGAR